MTVSFLQERLSHSAELFICRRIYTDNNNSRYSQLFRRPRNRNEVVRYLTSVHNLMSSPSRRIFISEVFRAGLASYIVRPELRGAIAVITGGQLIMV